MADDLRMALTNLLRKTEMAGDVDFLRDGSGFGDKRRRTTMVAATIRTVFAQPDAGSARDQWRRVADSFRSRFPRLAELMDEAETDVLAYTTFPV